MPDFLTWGMDKDTNQFGAYVQLNASTFKPQPDGRVLVEKTPRTEFFNGEKINRMAEVAGPKSKPFWQQMSEVFPSQQALFENARDIGTEPQTKVAGVDLGLNLTNKPVFQA